MEVEEKTRQDNTYLGTDRDVERVPTKRQDAVSQLSVHSQHIVHVSLFFILCLY